MILDNYYTTDSAAEFLGVSKMTVHKLAGKGKLKPTKVGTSNLYYLMDLEICKGRWYADGLSHKDIGRVYGKKRTTVIYHYKRLKVKPTGVDGRRKGQPAVYSAKTAAHFARILGWKPT